MSILRLISCMKRKMKAGCFLSGLVAMALPAHANVLAVETDAATGGIRELRIVGDGAGG